MIINIFKIVCTPLVSYFYFKKYGDIWEIKKVLQRQKCPSKSLLGVYNRYFHKNYGSWISYRSIFSGTPFFPHKAIGVFISGEAKIGKNAVIFQQVTIGSNTLRDSKRGSPTIGDNVYIGAGAKIIGDINIGDNCRIGANAVVYEDMSDNSVAIQQPTRILKKNKLDNRFFSKRNGVWMYYKEGNWIEEKENS